MTVFMLRCTDFKEFKKFALSFHDNLCPEIYFKNPTAQNGFITGTLS